MENKLNKRILNYAIKQFEQALKDNEFGIVFDGVCQVLWNRFGFPHRDVTEISQIGKGYTEQVSKKHGIETGNMWWFHGGDTKTQTIARLEVLKLIKENDK